MFETVKDIICTFSETDANEILPESTLRKDLCLNSLDIVNLAVAIEDETGIHIPDRDLATFFTVDDLIKFIEKAETEY